MALLVNNCVLNNGLSLDGVYVRIDQLSGNKEAMTMRLTYYVSQDMALQSMNPLQISEFHFEPDIGYDSYNYHRQGYDNLKKLDFFKNAVDILEDEFA